MSRKPPNAKSRGRTLQELLVALTVSGILFALLTAALIGHDRLTSGSAAIAELRAGTRQAQQIIPAMLRAATSSDFYALTDTLADFEYTIASAVTCHGSAPHQLILAPDSIAAGQHFASWTHTPQPGDLVHIFDPGVHTGPGDDRWWTASLASLAGVPNACTGSPLLDSIADASHRARLATLTWSAAAPTAIASGAVVRFTRRTRAYLYASSGQHFLGVSDFDRNTSRWSVVQPASGPYASPGPTPGLQLVALDSLSGVTTSAAIASIMLGVRAQTSIPMRIPGLPSGVRTESLSAHIALRNR